MSKYSTQSGNPHLTALWLSNPQAAAALVHEAVAAAPNRKQAALKLGVAKRTLLRWLSEKPELQ
jgi:hypothetical protein